MEVSPRNSSSTIEPKVLLTQGDSPQKGCKVDGIWINPVQGGVKLTEEQLNKLSGKEPVFVEGMQ